MSHPDPPAAAPDSPGVARNSARELRQVSWPTRSETVSSVAVVLIFLLLVGAMLGLADTALSALIDAAI